MSAKENRILIFGAGVIGSAYAIKFIEAGIETAVTATPNDGYELGTLVITDKNGTKLDYTSNGDGTYTFTGTGNDVTITATFTKIEVPTTNFPFVDVSVSEWYYDSVSYAHENGLFNGTSETTFSPEATMTKFYKVRLQNKNGTANK